LESHSHWMAVTVLGSQSKESMSWIIPSIGLFKGVDPRERTSAENCYNSGTIIGLSDYVTTRPFECYSTG